jgi:dienelactone hydrolase
VLLVAVVAALAAVPAAARADVSPLGLSCQQVTDNDDRTGRACLGRVASYDGVPLDVDVSLPQSGDGPFPLVVLLPGYGGHWAQNGFGFSWTDRGYAVLNYTERGINESCGSEASRLAGGPGCATGWLHFAHAGVEVRDTQYLAGRLADDGVIDGRRIGVTGYSYGGGQSYMLATLRDRTVAADGSIVPWQSPQGKPMAIAAAAPVVGWSDLVSALLPNGRSLDYVVPDAARDVAPVGVAEQVLLDAMLTTGEAFGYLAPAGVDPSADVRGWHERLSDGEPYDGDPKVAGIVDELAKRHSALFMPLPAPPAPILITQGTPDDLFPPSEGLRYYNRVRSLHPSATVGLILLDEGHGRAIDGRGHPRIAARIDGWFDHYVKGVGDRPFGGIEAWVQTCPESTPPFAPYFAGSWPKLHPGEVRYRAGAAQVLKSSGGDPAIATAVTPDNGHECARTKAAPEPGTATYRLPPAPSVGYTLMGSPTVTARLDVTGQAPVVAARLWDVAPDGKSQELVARGLVRPGADGRHTFQLGANAWHFYAGHVPKLQLLGRDPPYARVSNGTFSVAVSDLDLRLPVAEPAGSAQVGWPAAPVVPAGARLAPGVSARGGPPDGLPATGGRGLRLDLAYRHDGKCRRRRVVATVRGPGLRWVARVDFLVAGLRIDRDSSPPFRVSVRRGRARSLRARATLLDGQRVSISRKIRRCG